MVNFKTFYRDLGTLENGDTFTLYVTQANNIKMEDTATSEFVKEFIKIISECDFNFALEPTYNYYIGSFKVHPTGKVIEQVRTENEFKTDNENVLSLQIMVKDVYHDIYTVCTSKKFRSIGDQNQKRILKYKKLDGTIVTSSYTQVLFNFILETVCAEYPKGIFSLGVLFENPYFDAAVKLYTRAGFGAPSITRNLNIRDNIYPHPLLKLEARCGLLDPVKEIWEDNFEKAINLKKTYYEKYLGETIEITISKKLNTYLTQLLTHPYETGGGFSLIPVIPNTKYDLMYICGLEKPGTELKTDIPRISLSMHTHPMLACTKINCEESWPSSIDFIIYFVTSITRGVFQKAPSLDIVVSPAGYYIHQASQYFYDFFMKGFKPNAAQYSCDAKAIYAKFVANFIVVYVSYLDVERYKDISDEYTRYVFISHMNQLSIKNMLKYTLEMVDRLLFLYSNNKSMYDTFIRNIMQTVTRDSGYPEILYYIPNFLHVGYPLDIVGIIESTFKPNNSDEVHRFLTSMKNGNFDGPILEDCKANNIDITEPLFITTFIDDFLVNPDIESASFIFYNIDRSKPHAADIMRLQDAVNKKVIVEQMRESKDFTIGLYPPSTVAEFAVNKLEKHSIKYSDSCDYSFYADPGNMNYIPAIK